MVKVIGRGRALRIDLEEVLVRAEVVYQMTDNVCLAIVSYIQSHKPREWVYTACYSRLVDRIEEP